MTALAIAVALTVLCGEASARDVIESLQQCRKEGGTWRTRGRRDRGCVIRGKKEGRWTALPGARARWVRTYRLGTLHGPVILYHPGCHRAEEGQYRDGRRSGKWTKYYANGTKEAEGDYDDDLRSGTWVFYYKDGARVREGAFRNDVEQGLFTEWFTNGQRWQQVRFDGGRRQGRTPSAVALRTGDGWWTTRAGCRDVGWVARDMGHGWVGMKTAHELGAAATARASKRAYGSNGIRLGSCWLEVGSGEVCRTVSMFGGVRTVP